MAPYTYNLAQNPGMQLRLSGYAAINNTTISLSALNTGGTLFGNAGLLAITPGLVPNEGVITPDSSIPQTSQFAGPFSFSVYIYGIVPANLTVYAVANPGGIILGSVPVSVTNNYQRVVINNIPGSGSYQSFYLIVTTTSAQAAQFWMTNVQIEPETPAHNYCDGGQPGCAWVNTVGGQSFQQYQNTIQASSSNFITSKLVTALVQGEAFNINASSTNTIRSSLITNTTDLGPVGAMTDFAIFALTDPDPAETYGGWNTAGATVPSGGTYARNWGTFFPPQNYYVSGNTLLYPQAAFMAVGWQFSGLPNNGWAELTDVQVEVLPYTTGFAVPSPSVYDLPRAIETIVKPDRLNFCQNPGIEISTQFWSAIAGGVLTRDNTTYVIPTEIIDDQLVNASQASLNVAVTNSTGDGAQITLTNLIAGDQYIVSTYVQANSNVSDILMSCNNGSTDILHGNSGTGYGDLGYGGGYYGGNPPANAQDLYGSGLYGSGLYGVGPATQPLATGVWYRIYTTFTALDSTATVKITANISSPTNFWIDDTLVEAGQVLGTYFDGNYGNNFSWETGGTPGLTRSYYYDEFAVKQQAVTNVLEHHTPLGISFTTPQFSVPYTQ